MENKQLNNKNKKPISKEAKKIKKLEFEVEQSNKKMSDLALDIISKDQIIENSKKEIDNLKIEIKLMNESYKTQIVSKMEQANKELQQKIADNNDKLKREIEYIKKYGIKDQVLDLIDIVSQFDMAVSYKLSDEKLINYQRGFKIFSTMFNKLLDDLNIKIIEPKAHDEFDSNLMECLETIHDKNFKDNEVVHMISKGYKLYDQVLKPAVVRVNKE